MMGVEYANQDLAGELYKLSGWEGDDIEIINGTVCAVAYSLGYLLRKLPSGAGVVKNSQNYTARRPHSFGSPENADPFNGRIGWDADTPENALCVMAIELFKQGVLTK